MLPIDALRDVLSDRSRSQREKLLFILGADGARPKSTTEIKQIAVSHGLRAAKAWKPSSILAGGPALAVLTSNGWELTGAGRTKFQELAGNKTTPTTQPAADLRAHLAAVSEPNTREFLAEAVACLEGNQLRAAVVFSWVGAVSVLHEHVVKHALVDFNAEAARRDPKWKPAKNADDLGRMKEFDFLNVLEAISVIGKNVKAELQAALSLRNACGHPSSLKIGLRRVAAHIELLLLNVFQKF